MNSLKNRLNLLRWYIGGILFSSISYPGGIKKNTVKLAFKDVPIKGLPHKLKGLKIGLMADFHRGKVITEEHIDKSVLLIQQEQPDLILLAGDFIDHNIKFMTSCAKALSNLFAPLGVYAVLGNHDYWGDATVVKTMLEEVNIHVLVNQSVEIIWKGEKILLIGLDDLWEGKPDFETAFSNKNNDIMKILLVHEPDYALQILSLPYWIPLQLSGHSHGGQVNIPLIGRPFLPPYGDRYPLGLQYVEDKDRWVYTTCGIGVTFPLRLNCSPEVNMLTLTDQM